MEVIRDLIKKQIPTQSVQPKVWLSWYRGEVNDFHNYRIYNGETYLPMKRKTLQMAKQVCETWANLLLNERCDIIMPDNDKKALRQHFIRYELLA